MERSELAMTRSPSLPPLLLSEKGSPSVQVRDTGKVHASPRNLAPALQKEASKRRFSAAEQDAFGCRPYERIGLPGLRHRSASQPSLRFVKQRSSSEAIGAPCTMTSTMADPSVSSRMHPDEPTMRGNASLVPLAPLDIGTGNRAMSTIQATSDIHADSRVKSAIERLLPAAGVGPSTLGGRAFPKSLPSMRGCGSPPLKRLEKRKSSKQSLESPSAKFPKEALEQFRLNLLRQYRSLRDARGQVERFASLDKLLSAGEMQRTFSRIGECKFDEFFVQVGTDWPGGVTITDFFNSLASASTEALLWEFRCCLVSAGIWPNELSEVVELVQKRLQGDSKRRSSKRAARNCATMAEHEEVHGHELQDEMTSASLSHDEWLRFAETIGLTAIEAKRLHGLLSDRSGVVDVPSVFDIVHATVAPAVTLFRFTSNLLDRYTTLRQAFASVCAPHCRMTWDDFFGLASTLGVDERSGKKMWDALARGLIAETPQEGGVNRTTMQPALGACSSEMIIVLDEDEIATDSADGLTEEQFVQRMVRWIPPDAFLASLREKLVDHFGSLPAGRRALKQHGLGGGPLSPRQLGRGLNAAGIELCDPDILIAVAAAVAEGVGGLLGRVTPSSSHLTLDDVFEQLHLSTQAARRPDRSSDHYASATQRVSLAAETQGMGEQISDTQANLKRGGRLDEAEPDAEPANSRKSSKSSVGPVSRRSSRTASPMPSTGRKSEDEFQRHSTDGSRNPSCRRRRGSKISAAASPEAIAAAAAVAAAATAGASLERSKMPPPALLGLARDRPPMIIAEPQSAVIV